MIFYEITLQTATGGQISFGLYFLSEYDARNWVEFTYPGHAYTIYAGTLPTQ